MAFCAVPHKRRDKFCAQTLRGPHPLGVWLNLVPGRSLPRERRQALLAAVRAYQQHPHRRRVRARPVAFALGSMRVLDYGGEGQPVLLVPSLINPSWVLDLEPQRSLVRDLRRRGHRCFLLDWGEPTGEELSFTIADYVRWRLLPAIAALPGPLALVGYCLGGTMSLAAAQLSPRQVCALGLIAAPWGFEAYPAADRQGLADFWAQYAPTARSLGRLPMEILQLAFWAQNPESAAKKYLDFAALDPDSAAARRFVLIEDWANSGPPLSFPAARECFEDFFAADLPGQGAWRVGAEVIRPDRLDIPVAIFAASRDRLVPVPTALAAAPASSLSTALDLGHVGMIVGAQARRQLYAPLSAWLTLSGADLS